MGVSPESPHLLATLLFLYLEGGQMDRQGLYTCTNITGHVGFKDSGIYGDFLDYMLL